MTPRRRRAGQGYTLFPPLPGAHSAPSSPTTHAHTHTHTRANTRTLHFLRSKPGPATGSPTPNEAKRWPRGCCVWRCGEAAGVIAKVKARGQDFIPKPRASTITAAHEAGHAINGPNLSEKTDGPAQSSHIHSLTPPPSSGAFAHCESHSPCFPGVHTRLDNARHRTGIVVLHKG